MVRKTVLLILINLILLLFPKHTLAPGLEFRQEKMSALLERIFIEKETERFMMAIRESESPDWKAVNPIGCMGWFQFSGATLKELGYGHISSKAFRADPGIFLPETQVELFYRLISLNESELIGEIELYSGQVINGILITKSGILAGAHLGGACGVRSFLRSGGKYNPWDRNKTSIADYVKKFQGYLI